MTSKSSPVDEMAEHVTALYSEPLDSFVARRGELAKQLKAEGRRDASAAVAKIRKPTVAAWAIDAAARSDPDRIAVLVDAGDRLRTVQAQLLGGASPNTMRAALDERRTIIRSIVDDAVARMSAAGGNGDGARDEFVATLEAASLDPDLAADLAGGRLAKTVAAPVGFDVLGGLGGFAAAAPDDAAPDDTARRADDDTVRRAEDDEAARRAEDDEAERRRRAEAAAREAAAREARAAADAAWRAVYDARADVEHREGELARLERELEAARRAVDDAERAADDAERAAVKAERRAAR